MLFDQIALFMTNKIILICSRNWIGGVSDIVGWNPAGHIHINDIVHCGCWPGPYPHTTMGTSKGEGHEQGHAVRPQIHHQSRVSFDLRHFGARYEPNYDYTHNR